MKKTLFILTCLLFTGNLLFAQYMHFTTSGTITFEKTSNIYALITKQMNKDNEAFFQPVFDEYKKKYPQFKKAQSTLTFANNKTLYTPIEDPDNTQSNFFEVPMADQNNITFTDMTLKSTVIQKKVFEETFLVKDSTRKINWKITSETREIAGYTCRRANAIIMDSIYVVAFYTDQIHVSGGPESFTGLPGMILGVALPHENVTWFATKVVDNAVPENTIVPPKKGKPVDNKGLATTLKTVLKNWEQEERLYLKAFLL